jgi:hypothetical protein
MAISCSFLTSAIDTAGRSAYTFSGLSLGAASADRLIAVLVNGNMNGDNRSVSSVTVAGQSASQIVAANYSVSFIDGLSALWVTALPAGTSGDVVVTLSGSANDLGIGLLRVTGAESSAADTATDTVDPCTAIIDVPEGGLLIGTTACDLFGTGQTCTWTNLTEAYDQQIEAGAVHSGAFGVCAAAQTGLSVTADWSSSTGAAMVLASFVPIQPHTNVNLSGASATGAAGTFGKTIETTLAGVSSAGHAGAFGISVLKTLTGVAATGQAGAFTPEVLLDLLGIEGTMALGALVADTATRINLVGVSATGSAGTFTTAVEILLAGNGMTGDVGALASEVSVALQAVAAETGVGDFTISDGWTRIGGNAGTVWTNKPDSAGNSWAVVSNPVGNTWTNKN